jgi:hypothetical protein
MVILEAGRKRERAEAGQDSPWEDHPHFSPEAVEQRRATHERLRGRPGGPQTRLHP